MRLGLRRDVMYFCPHTLKGVIDRAHTDIIQYPTHA